MQATAAPTGTDELATYDLGPLAWVLEELRKSLDGATKALRRFVRDAELARGSDLAALDASQLRIARQQLHQAVGALEMVGMVVPAKVLRAMEALAQRFVQRPELCSDDAANKLERASFALTEYLEGALKGKKASSVALFPQYRDVQVLVGDDRVHPADLWPYEWHWIDAAMPQPLAATAPDATLVARMDGCILKVVQSHDPKAASTLRDISLVFAAEQAAMESRVFWKICAAYFEAVAHKLCPSDVYAKRAASRILLQGRGLSRGEPSVSERLVRELLFFCAQAVPAVAADAPVLAAIRSAYGLTQTRGFDYETPQFGRFDPALLVQARKRIAAATETWSALAGGDTNRLKLASEQFGLVGELVLKLHPESGALVHALTAAIETTLRSGDAPTPALAMEVATSVLYLEAAYDDMDPTDSHMTERSVSLAARLAHVNAGGQPEPLERWMEDLYRRVSDRQIMGSVVDELRKSIGEVEKSLDTFFRNPLDKVPLHEVPSQLAQMRGVFSVLGLDQAALATLRMRSTVEKFLVDDIDVESARTGIFLKLGNSLGAIGFLIDMLSYQRELAKKLFVYDEDLGEFKPVMGSERSTEPIDDADEVRTVVVPKASADGVKPPAETASRMTPPVTALPPAPTLPAATAESEDDNAELKDIFLEEAREVVQAGLAATEELATNPSDLAQQTTLRRAFHTLKGSSRMVGFTEFGEAAWAMEQLLNHWLAEQKPASAELLGLATTALRGFDCWVEDFATDAAAWNAQPFRQSADALRLGNPWVPLALPRQAEKVPAAATPPTHPVESDPAETPVTLVEQPAASLPPPAPEETPQFQGVAPSGEPPHEPSVVVPEPPAPPVAEPELGILAEAATEPEPEVAAKVAADHEDQIKVIGDLRIGIPLYNVYLNEADEWSRRLLTELTEWALELDRPVHDSTVGLAHSLSGSSATVGFIALSDIARALEQALRHVRLHAQVVAEYAKVFVDAAEDIRRLLHQFAAGFLKQPDQSCLDSLNIILATEFPPGAPSVRDSLYEEEPAELELEAGSGFDSVGKLEAEPLPEAPAPGVTAQTAGGDEQAVEQFHAEPQTDDIGVTDAIDVDLLPIFEEEALELLPQLGGALRQWTARPENLGARKEVLRVLHTLKGSARLAGAMRLGEMTHQMESAIEVLGTEFSQAPNLEPLLIRFDTIRATFEQLLATPERERTLPEAARATDDAQTALPAPLAAAPVGAVPVVAAPAMATAGPALAPLRHAPNQTVRVRAQLLDRMVNQAGEVMITRARLEARLGQLRTSLTELTGNLDRLRNLLRDIELQSESQMQSRLAQAKDSAQGFDPLEFDRFTRVQELTRMMAESVHDVATVQRNLHRTVEGTEDDLIAQGRQARDLQRDLLRTRMVEFDGVAERLHRAVRQAAKDADKQVRLEIRGGSLDMDRGVLERMLPAFEHLLRNAVGHGIEQPQARIAAGKPETGLIQIILQQHSDEVTVELRDDGAGLDLDQLRVKAVASGHIGADARITDAELIKLIYTSGFTTAPVVTELSGRGVGLDIVRSEVQALGGRIETSTQRGLGTNFTLVLPLTTAVTQVVMLRMGELVIGVPANLVEMVRRVPLADLERAYETDTFEFDHQMIPFFWVGALLQASANSGETRTKTMAVAIFRSAGQRLAAHIDEVLGNQEVVVKNLGLQLSRLPGLVGMSVLASGAVVLIYNPVALAAVYGAQARQFRRDAQRLAATLPAADAQPKSSLVASLSQTPLILVVDDSITVRRVTQRLLKREGFRVVLANDGLQALERLQEERPAVVLSDIEMPRMDGFDLARNIRADAKLADLPIIMITSRIAEKHRDHARELGVNHYLGKPYSEDVLVGLIRQHCAATPEPAQ